MGRLNSVAVTRLLLLVSLLSSVLVASSFFGFASGTSGTAIVQAGLTVVCGWTIGVSTSYPVYVIPSNIDITYSANTGGCTISQLSGDVNTVNVTSSSLLTSNPVTLSNVGITPVTGTLQFPSNSAMQGEDNAILDLEFTGVSQGTSATYYVIRPANIILSQFNVTPSSVSAGSSVTFTANVYNDGQLAANNIAFNLGADGQIFADPLQSLLPGQSEQVSLQLSTVTSSSGDYDALANVTFNSIYTQSGTTYTSPTLYSSNQTTTYTVTGGGGGHHANTTVNFTLPILSTVSNAVFITTAPVFISTLANNATIQYLGFMNNLNSSVWINFTIPEQSLSTALALSTDSLLLRPHTSGLLQYAIAPNSTTAPGTYIAAVDLSVTQQNAKPISTALFTKVNVLGPQTAPYVSTSVLLLNASKSAEEQFEVHNPTNKTYYGLQLSVPVPVVAVPNYTQVVQLGSIHNITLFGDQFILNWRIPELQPGGTALASSTVSSVAQPQVFASPAVSLSTPSAIKSSSQFRVLFIDAPPIQVDSNGTVTIESIYTGTNVTNTTFNFIPPPGQSVTNPFRRIQVIPNQVSTTTYKIGPLTQAGTQLFTLTVDGYFGTQTYSVPVVVSPPPSTSVTIATPSPYNVTIAGVLLGVSIVSILVIVYYIRRMSKRGPTYNKARAEKLRNIRKRISEEA